MKKDSVKTEEYKFLIARIPEQEHQAFKLFCTQAGKSMVEVLRELIRKTVEGSP